MTTYMMPRVYGRLLPSNLKLVLTDKELTPNINHTLHNYLTIATKASEQYVEIWDSMIKTTNMYDAVDKTHYVLQEMFSVFKITLDTTTVTHQQNIISSVIESICGSKKGRNAILKIGNVFSQIAVHCMYILSLCFNEVYIYKPMASPAISPDKYVICKDFKLIDAEYLTQAFSEILSSLLKAQQSNCLSLYTRKINNNYINTLIEANSVIGQQQLEAINNTITLIEQGRKKEKIDALQKQQTLKYQEWNKKFGVTYQQTV
jgi:hypothetical protein